LPFLEYEWETDNKMFHLNELDDIRDPERVRKRLGNRKKGERKKSYISVFPLRGEPSTEFVGGQDSPQRVRCRRKRESKGGSWIKKDKRLTTRGGSEKQGWVESASFGHGRWTPLKSSRPENKTVSPQEKGEHEKVSRGGETLGVTKRVLGTFPTLGDWDFNVTCKREPVGRKQEDTFTHVKYVGTEVQQIREGAREETPSGTHQPEGGLMWVHAST